MFKKLKKIWKKKKRETNEQMDTIIPVYPTPTTGPGRDYETRSKINGKKKKGF